MTSKTTANSSLAKKLVQCLNEAMCFVSNFVLAESFVLRNPLLRQALKRQVVKKPQIPSQNTINGTLLNTDQRF